MSWTRTAAASSPSRASDPRCGGGSRESGARPPGGRRFVECVSRLDVERPDETGLGEDAGGEGEVAVAGSCDGHQHLCDDNAEEDSRDERGRALERLLAEEHRAERRRQRRRHDAGHRPRRAHVPPAGVGHLGSVPAMASQGVSTTSSVGAEGGSSDWTAQAADTIESVVGSIRDRTAVPAETAARALVYGILIVVMGSASAVLLTVGAVRLLDNWLRIWAVYMILGGLFTAAGLLLWRMRRPTASA